MSPVPSYASPVGYVLELQPSLPLEGIFRFSGIQTAFPPSLCLPQTKLMERSSLYCLGYYLELLPATPS